MHTPNWLYIRGLCGIFTFHGIVFPDGESLTKSVLNRGGPIDTELVRTDRLLTDRRLLSSSFNAFLFYSGVKFLQSILLMTVKKAICVGLSLNH